jgi:hypothetical protein
MRGLKRGVRFRLPGGVDDTQSRRAASHRPEALAVAHELLKRSGEGVVMFFIPATHRPEAEGLAIA